MRTDYLTESLLKEFLAERGLCEYKKRSFKIGTNTVIPDFVSSDGCVIVEFDGFHHYTQTRRCYRDMAMRNFCDSERIRLIEIPYFVQFNSEEVVRHFFDGLLNDYSSFNSYPHGFIDSKCEGSYDFCRLGLHRFNAELNHLPQSVVDAIMKSDAEKLSNIENKWG